MIPRDIITASPAPITARRSSAPISTPAIAANPFLTFFTVATESGTFAFKWTGDNGFVETASATITVE